MQSAFKDRAMLHLGDCLEVLPTLMDGSADAAIIDLPYGCLNRSSEGGKWDCQIPMKPLWQELLRVVKPTGAIVLFSQGLFTAQLIMSQPKLFRYTLVWDKCRASGFLNANRAPLRRHEDICVFYRKQPTYNPQLVRCDDPKKQTHSRGLTPARTKNSCYGAITEERHPDKNRKFPGSILSFPRPHATGHHPTEKPVDLLRWLIRTYTNPGETVLDATMGSGSTCIAAILEGRKTIGIEREQKYYDVARQRIDEVLNTPRQEELGI